MTEFLPSKKQHQSLPLNVYLLRHFLATISFRVNKVMDEIVIDNSKVDPATLLEILEPILNELYKLIQILREELKNQKR